MLTQRMNSHGDRLQSAPAAQPVVGPPPLHVRIAVEAPVNPHGPILSQEEEEQSSDESSQLQATHVVSDPDDWCFEAVEEPDAGGGIPPYIRTRDAPRGKWPDWAIAVCCDDAVFIPQLGDDVVLCKKSYLRMQATTGSDFHLPPDLPELFTASVTAVNPHQHGFVLQLTELGEEPHQLEILYRFPTLIPFLVLRIRWSVLSRWIEELRPGDKLTIQPMDEDGMLTVYTGKVLAVNPGSDANPDLSISIDWGDEAGCISPWEIVKRNGQFAPYPDSSSLVSQYIGEFAASLIKVLEHPKNATIIHLPAMRGTIELPCSFYMIYERIENAWYRKFQGVIADLKLTLKTNIAAFGADAPETKTTRKRCNSLTETLQKTVQQVKNKRRVKRG
jgi:hypothetical protein